VTQAERYRAAGVDLEAADQAKRRIAESVASTRTELARGALGAFGGMIRVPDGFEHPVLVMSTDGVGTKVLVAIRAGRHDSVGEDLVNHSVNDILVHGATPLAFLDYLAVAGVATDTIAALVEGVARGCRQHEMTLVGGETAQLPDLYQAGHYDLAGTTVMRCGRATCWWGTPRADSTPTDTRWRAKSCSTSSGSTSTASFPISV
jgi:phosphoribosylformylglycinamidine cyclo-ligase